MSQSIDEQIEENVRFCEELLKRNPNFAVKEDFSDLDGFWEEMPQEDVAADEPSVVPFEPEYIAKREPASEAVRSLPEKSGTSAWRTVRSLLICIVIAVAAGVLITKFVANYTLVEGSSMEPALQNGNHLVVEKVSYLMGEPQRFDIIVFEHSANAKYIKRVIGLPGEQIQISEGKIYINDKPIYDEYGNGSMEHGGIASEKLTLGPHEYFVLGDNRDGSEDSRSEMVGPVSEDKILGRAWLRILPADEFGLLH